MKVKNYKRVNECAVINTDYNALQAYKKRKKKMQEMEMRINNMEEKLDLILQLLQEKNK